MLYRVRLIRQGVLLRQALSGHTNRLAFTRGANIDPLQSKHMTLLRIGYQLDGTRLYRLIWPVLDRPLSTKPIKQLLLKGVSSIKGDSLFHYFQTPSNRVDYWPIMASNAAISNFNQVRLPLAISIHFKLKKLGTMYRIFIIHAQGFYANSQTAIPSR